MEEGTGCKQRELVSGGKRPPGAPQSENIAYREVNHEFQLTKKNPFQNKTHRGDGEGDIDYVLTADLRAVTKVHPALPFS